MSTIEVGETVLEVVTANVSEGVAFMRLSVVVCIGPCAKAGTTTSASVAARANVSNIAIWTVILRGAM